MVKTDLSGPCYNHITLLHSNSYQLTSHVLLCCIMCSALSLAIELSAACASHFEVM
jgi:hypothetical protein